MCAYACVHEYDVSDVSACVCVQIRMHACVCVHTHLYALTSYMVLAHPPFHDLHIIFNHAHTVTVKSKRRLKIPGPF